MQHSHSMEVRNPGPYAVSSKTRNLFVLCLVLGLVALAAGFKVDSKRTWFTFLHNHFYFMSLALGGAFFAAIQFLTGAMWSAPVRRIAESLTSYIPVSTLTFAVVYFGIHDVYHWSHPEVVKGDVILEGKASYLNIAFFMIRNILVLGLLAFFTKKIVGNSLAQDESKDASLTLKNKGLAPGFLLVFAIGFTMASFDQIMSLDPHWYSTMFGVYCFAGLFYSVLALLGVLTVTFKRKGALVGIVNENLLHDLGKFMFAFTVFWAYIGFSQFMLIWYANMPEETGYFISRLKDGWFAVSIFLVVGKFMTPFFLLLPRDAKRNESMIFGVGIFMLVAQWIDVLWLAQPELFKTGPRVGWIELGGVLAFTGLFGLVVSRFLGRHNLVAIGDPRLSESVHHHHQ